MHWSQKTWFHKIFGSKWWQYSIDHSKQKAVFSFFRSTFDKPIFQIEKKNNVKSKLLFDFSITYKQKIIETNVSLSKILKRLDKKFEFFQRNKQG